MKNYLVILLGLAMLLIAFTGCSEKTTTSPNDNQATAPELAQTADTLFTVPDSLTNYNSQEIDYNGETVTAFALEQFVPETAVNNFTGADGFDSRVLFAVEIVSSDEDGNWTPRSKGYEDLDWNQFKTGWLIPSVSGKAYFPDDSIITGYDVKHAHYFKLYRKIEVTLSDTILFETGAFETEQVTYTKDGEEYIATGFPLSNLISDYVTTAQADYNYHFIAADGWINNDTNNLYSWDNIRNGYWLSDSDKAIFLNDAHETIFKSVRVLETIELIPQ